MSPAFAGYHFQRDRDQIVQKAMTLGLTPIIEELEELTLHSSVKKVRDDSTLVTAAITAVEPLTTGVDDAEEIKRDLTQVF